VERKLDQVFKDIWGGDLEEWEAVLSVRREQIAEPREGGAIGPLYILGNVNGVGRELRFLKELLGWRLS
jgi:hypothetical protein